MTTACASDARRLLTSWVAPTPDQSGVRDRFLQFVAEHGPRAADRDLRVGHLTASTLLLDRDRVRTLLTLHPLVGHWVQLGGHVEPGDLSMAGAAQREVVEESGIVPVAVETVPIGLDWHAVTCRDSARTLGPSAHLDVTFLAVAPTGAEPVRSDESLDLAWFALDALPPGADAVVRRLVRAARALGMA